MESMNLWQSVILISGCCLATWTSSGEEIELLVATGQPSPDGDGVFRNGTLVSGYDVEALTEDGAVIFTALLVGTDDFPSDEMGLFRSDGKNAAALYRTGDVFESQGVSYELLNDNFVDGKFVNVVVGDDGSGIVQTTIWTEDRSFSSGSSGLVFGENRFLAGVTGEVVEPTGGGESVTLITFADRYSTAGGGRYYHVGAFVDTDLVPPQPRVDVFSASFSDTEREEVSRLGLGEEIAQITTNLPVLVRDFAANSAGDLMVLSPRGVLVRSEGVSRVYGAMGDVTPDGLGTFIEVTAPDGDGSVFNAAGETLFLAAVQGLTGRFSALYLTGKNGELREILRQGDQLETEGEQIIGITEWRLNDEGEVFALVSRGSFDSLILRVDPDGRRHQLVATGDPIPSDDRVYSIIEQINANNRGQVSFLGKSSGAGFSTGLYVYDPSVDDVVTVLDDQGGMIGENPVVGLVEKGSTQGYGFNNAGQAAFSVVLEDGRQGIARYTPAQVGPAVRYEEAVAVSTDGDAIEVEVATVIGDHYQLLRSPDLKASTFGAVGQAVVGDGGLVKLRDNEGRARGRRGFYLVRREKAEP